MARYAVISDIHANLAALEAVLAALEAQRVAEIWHLGDVVVYGPHPNECLQKLQEIQGRWKITSVLGNNDLAVLKQVKREEIAREMGLTGADPQLARYREATQASHEWTISALTPESFQILQEMEPGPRNVLQNDVLVHASPCEPVGTAGNYLMTLMEAEEAFWCLGQVTDLRLCFFGHTHVSTLFEEITRDRAYDNCRVRLRSELVGQKVQLGDQRWLVNPGSVGQPRDGDNRPAYAILDTDENCIEFHRVDYVREKTLEGLRRLVNSGLSKEVVDILIRRLREGS